MTSLVAFLDLSVCPVSYDAVIFMAQAEMERWKVGADRLHVVAFGEMRKKSQYDEAEAEWRLWNIVVPAAHLFGSTVSNKVGLRGYRLHSELETHDYAWPKRWALQTLSDRQHLVGGLIERVKAGEQIARPKASEHARRKVREWYKGIYGWPVVTFTRRSTYLQERNSDLSVWEDAKSVIFNKNFRCVDIDDTETALLRGSGYAELNLDLRMAMYEEAAFNICANTGPASLLWLSDRPYAMMGAGVPADEWDGLFVKQGLPLGESWPWALPHQRIAYGKETAAQIVEEFNRWASATS